MIRHHPLFSIIACAIPRPVDLTIDGLRNAAAYTAAKVRATGSLPDLVCGFDHHHDLVGLMLEDADERQVFQAMFFEYGFSLEFNDAHECTVRVWVRDDYEWTGSDKEAQVRTSVFDLSWW